MKATLVKISLLAACAIFFSVSGVKAQNLPYVDDKPVHFGFSLGMNFMDFAVVPMLQANDVSVSSIIPGFSVGGIVDYKLNRYWNLRFTPTLHLGQRKLNYVDSASVTVLSIPLHLPVYLKWSAERYGNFRPYLIGGAGLWMDWGRNKDKPVLLKQYDTLLEGGIGCDIYFSFFKLCPELKFGAGLNDMLLPLSQRDSGMITEENKKYTDSIKKLTSRMFTLTFNFE